LPTVPFHRRDDSQLAARAAVPRRIQLTQWTSTKCERRFVILPRADSCRSSPSRPALRPCVGKK
jgi:hypothetical protein